MADEAPSVLVYACDLAPAPYRYLARFRVGDEFHPLIIHAADPVSAEARARAWWASELEKAARRSELAKSRAAAMRAARAKTAGRRALQGGGEHG